MHPGTMHSITASNVILSHHGISQPLWIQKENPVAMVTKLWMQIFTVLVVIFRSLQSMGLGNLGLPLLKGICSIKEWVGELQVSSLKCCHLVGTLRSRNPHCTSLLKGLKSLIFPQVTRIRWSWTPTIMSEILFWMFLSISFIFTFGLIMVLWAIQSYDT